MHSGAAGANAGTARRTRSPRIASNRSPVRISGAQSAISQLCAVNSGYSTSTGPPSKFVPPPMSS
jgi:hypothetical protein